MLHKQITVFIENKRGRLAALTRALGDGGVDIKALCIADTKDYGILRMVVDKPEPAVAILKGEGYAVNLTDVIAVTVDDCPGGLAAALKVLDECEINIEYLYHFARIGGQKAAIIICVNNPGEAAEKIKAISKDMLISAALL